MGKKMFGVSIRGGWVFLAAAFLTLLLATDLFAGSYVDTYGMSASGIARGNAMTAIVDDWSSVFYNPAGLGKTKKNYLNSSVAVEEEVEEDIPEGGEPVEMPPPPDYTGFVSELGLNYFYTSPQLEVSNKSGSVTDPTSGLKFGAGTLGLVIDLNRFVKQPDIVSSARFGLALGLIDKYLMRVNDTELGDKTFARYGRNAERIVILAGVGFGLLDDLISIGVGGNVLFDGPGYVRLEAVDTGATSQTAPDQMTQMDMKAMAAPTAGIAINLGDLDIGFSYRGSVWTDLNTDVENGTSAFGQTLPLELAVKLVIYDYYTPETMSVGLGYRLGSLQLSADYELQKWSGLEFGEAKKRYAADEGITIPEFDDIYVPKVGISYDIAKTLTVMAGYYFQPSFVPDDANNKDFNILDNDKHVYSLGVKALLPKMEAMSCPVQISAGYQYQDLKEREVRKTNNNTYGPNYTFGGKIHSFAVEAIIRW